MDRVKTKTPGSDNSQWVFNTNKVLKWIQDFFELNFKKFLNRFFIQSGVFFYGTQDRLKLTGAAVNGSKIDLTINAGSGITSDGDMIVLPNQIVNSDHDIQGNSTTYYVWLHHVIVDDTDTTYKINRLPSSYSDVNAHEKDSYELKYASAWPTGQELTDSVKIGIVERDGSGNLTITDARDTATIFGMPAAAWTWINTNYSEFDKDGTDADEFYVARSSYPPNGLKVLRESTEPAAPLNVRIYDINPYHSSPLVKRCRVTFKWGWEKLTGSHFGADGTNTIRVTGVKAGDYMALDVGVDELAGQRLYSPSFGSSDKSYLIESNLATSSGNTVITLESAYNDESMVENGVIRPNAEDLEMKVVPYYDGDEIPQSAEVVNLGSDFMNSPVVTLSLDLQWSTTGEQAYYNIYLRARTGWGTYSAWTPMAAGSYDPDHTSGGQGTVNYTAPFECKLPMLDDTGADLTLTPTTSGFEISVTGWNVSGDPDRIAHHIEIARTTLDTLDWDDEVNTEKVIGTNRFFEIPTSMVRRWQVGVRPHQNGQVVGTPIVKSVTSGAMGVAPGDQPFFQQLIDLRTYSGTLKYDGVTFMYYFEESDADLKSPAGGSTDAFYQNFIAYIQSKPCILTDSAGNDYQIDASDAVYIGGKAMFNLLQLNGGTALPATTSTTATINTSERGRRIAIMNGLQIEFNAVSAYFDSDVIRGADVSNKGVIRVAQNSPTGRAYADLLNVWQSDTPYDFSGDVDFRIRSSYGNLGLLIDCWDPSASSPNNTCSIRGLFTLYMRPHIRRTDGPEQI